MMEYSRFIKKSAPIFIIIIIIIIIIITSNLGIIANSDSTHGYNAKHFLYQKLFVWADSFNGGGYVAFPFLPLLIIESFLNQFGSQFSNVVVTFLLLLFLWYSTFLLTRYILKPKNLKENIILIIISSFIILNEVTKHYIIANNTVLWAELFMILSILFYIKFNNEGKIKYLMLALLTSCLTVIMFHSIILSLIFIVLYVLGNIIHALHQKNSKRFKTILFRLTIFLALLILLNMYFLLNNFFDIFNASQNTLFNDYNKNVVQTDSILKFTNEQYNNLGYNLIFSKDSFTSFYNNGMKIYNIIIYFSIIFLFFISFLLIKKEKDKEVKKNLMIFISIYLILLTLSFGPKDPFKIFLFFWNNLLGFKLFRDFYKFHWPILILIPIFCSYLVIKISNSLKKKYLVILLILFILPFISYLPISKYIVPFDIPNYYFDMNLKTSELKLDNKMIVMPIISWMQTYTWSNKNFDMQDPLGTMFMYKNIFINDVSYEESYQKKINKITVKYLFDKDPNFYKILCVRDIQYVIIRHDLDKDYIQKRSKNAFANLEYLEADILISNIEVDTHFNKFSKIGKFDIYYIKPQFFLPHFYTPKNIITSDQSIDTLPELVSKDNYEIRSAIFFTSQTPNINKQERIKTLPSKIENTPTLEFKKINPTKYRVFVHNTSESFPLVFSESFHNGWKAYQVDYEKPDLNINLLNNYKILDGNDGDQATKEEVNKFIEQGLISNLGNGEERTINHMKWENNKEKLDYEENYTIDFISKNFQGTIQNDNLDKGHFYETWLQKPIVNESNHLMANGYANSWIINITEICETTPNKCIQNSDGTYDLELVIEFWPQRLFYIGLMISGTTLLCCIGYLIYDWRRERKKEKGKDKRKEEERERGEEPRYEERGKKTKF